jgi:hypothetical protein
VGARERLSNLRPSRQRPRVPNGGLRDPPVGAGGVDCNKRSEWLTAQVLYHARRLTLPSTKPEDAASRHLFPSSGLVHIESDSCDPSLVFAASRSVNYEVQVTNVIVRPPFAGKTRSDRGSV